MRLLFIHEIKPELINNEDQTSLLRIIESENLKSMQLLLKQNVVIDFKDKEDRTSLF